jgi:glycosyltransferase involved in cell wall biosynthesis
MEKISLHIAAEHHNMSVAESGGMAIYCSNMIREYKAREDILICPQMTNPTRNSYPFGSIGLHHNFNGFKLDFKEFELPRNTKQIVTIHDTQEFEFPHYFNSRQIQERNEVYQWIRDSDPIVVSISEFTKNQLMEKASISGDNLHVVPHGFDHLLYWKGHLNHKKDWYSKQNYFYVPGKAWPHKGHLGLLRAVSKYLDFFRDHNLKLFFSSQPNDLGMGLQKWIEEYCANDVLVVLPHLNNERHVELMQNARLVLLPSMYEGFGLSYGESVYLNKKVVAFNLSPYREVSSVGHFVGVGDFGALVSKSIEVFESGEDQINDGGITKFTWEENVRKILELVRK